MILQCDQISKVFGTGRSAQVALGGVSLRFRRGETCVLLGPSGSGKTTLLSILGCLLSPTAGTVVMDGQQVRFSHRGSLPRWRRRYIGFVFQHAQLLPFLSIEQNLAIVGRNVGLSRTETRLRIDSILGRLGIAELRGKRPDLVSGGERQRAAIARALLHRPPVILADEPTAALDWQNGENVIALLTQQAREENALLITVTHDTRLVPFFDRVLRIDSGRIVQP